MIWIALLCSLLLPLTAFGETRAIQQEGSGCALKCDMPDYRCDCCQHTASHMRGCNCGNGFMPFLSPGKTVIQNRQATQHRLELITPVFKAFSADIFHPPKSELRSI
ncbi:MAG: hypothetical protein C4567_10340 [Deltaproteobacteria bacterium]|nr:MAG: hypothetical protein C4567_10340 [Deltaproteobacteria bacterium]